MMLEQFSPYLQLPDLTGSQGVRTGSFKLGQICHYLDLKSRGSKLVLSSHAIMVKYDHYI